MKTTKHVYSAVTIICFALLFMASAEVKPLYKTENTYAETSKASENISVSYTLPVIKPTGKTTQRQVKGGVTITVEIVPFSATRHVQQDKTIGYADPGKPGYDIYETTNTPAYRVSPDDVQFRIRIRNSEAVPLKLSEVGFALIIDGTYWSFPTGYLDDWNKGLILTGFDKDYTIKGPQLQGLNSAKVVYLFLNGVPTSYNEAGNITKKSNFEWYFECSSETVHKDEVKTYTYEPAPIYRERCNPCQGKGYFEKTVTCSRCSGAGQYLNQYNGKVMTCGSCSGHGKVLQKDNCSGCYGKGEKTYPKSKNPPVLSSFRWTGGEVQVVTIPPGALVSVVNTSTRRYENSGTTPKWVKWYSSDEKSYPIVVEYNGSTAKLLPYTANNKLLSKVVIDFTGSTPNVIKGQRVY